MPADTRLNHYAARRRDGRAEHEPRQRDHLAYAKACMHIWSDWCINSEESGWPSESLEARAMRLAQGKTETQGKARYTGRVVVGEDGETVAKDPPSFPKETRNTPPQRLPRIDRARVGPHVNRALLDLDEQGGAADAKVLRLHYMAHSRSAEAKAETLGISRQTYWNRHNRGIAWLAGRLSVR